MPTRSRDALSILGVPVLGVPGDQQVLKNDATSGGYIAADMSVGGGAPPGSPQSIQKAPATSFLTAINSAMQLQLSATALDPLVVCFADGFDTNGRKAKTYYYQSTLSTSPGALLANSEYYVALTLTGTTPSLTVTHISPQTRGMYPNTLAGVTVGPSLLARHFADTGSAATLASTSPSGVVTSNGYAGNYYLWRAVSGRDWMVSGVDTGNYAAVYAVTNGTDPLCYLRYDFGTAKTVRVVQFAVAMEKGTSQPWTESVNSSRQIYNNFKIQASANGSSWTNLYSNTLALQTMPWKGFSYDMGAGASYRYWRIGGSPYSGSLSNMGAIDFFPPGQIGDEFSVEDNIMYDSTNTKVYRIYLGRIRTSATGAINYLEPLSANTRYDSGFTISMVPGSTVVVNHRLGVVPEDVIFNIRDAYTDRPKIFSSSAGNYSTSVNYGMNIINVTPWELVLQSGKSGQWAASQGEYMTQAVLRVIARRGY